MSNVRYFGLRPYQAVTGDFARAQRSIDPTSFELRIGDPVHHDASGMVRKGAAGESWKGAVTGLTDASGRPAVVYPGGESGWTATFIDDPFQEFVVAVDGVLSYPQDSGRFIYLTYGTPRFPNDVSTGRGVASSVTSAIAGMDLALVQPSPILDNAPGDGQVWIVRIANHQDLAVLASGGEAPVAAENVGVVDFVLGNTYAAGTLLAYNGQIYRVTVSNSGQLPTNTTYFALAYEPAFSKNTAFNKNFGTGASDVARGNHTHDASAITNLDFALIQNVPQAFALTPVTSIDSPGSDLNVPTERAVRTALDQKANADVLSGITDAHIPASIARDTEVTALLAGKVTANPPITGGTFTKVVVGTNGLILSGGPLQDSDIPASIARDSELSGLLVANAAVTPGTGTKVTWDSKGLITGGTSLVAADIPVELARLTSVWTRAELAATGGDGTKVDWSQIKNAPTAGPTSWLDSVADMTALAAIVTTGFTGGESVVVEDADGSGNSAIYIWSGGDWAKYVNVDFDPISQATETEAGKAELATSAEAIAGTDTARIVTPAGLLAVLNARTASETATGLVELATTAEATTGTDTARAVTPAGLLAALNARTATTSQTGLVELATSAETIAGIDTARSVTPAGLEYVLTQRAYMRAATYDPNNKSADAFDADNHVFAPGASGLTATNTQAAILEVHGLLPGAPTPASETAQGIIELATSAEAIAGADLVRAITPATLSATITSVAMRKATYDPNNKATDCFAAGNIVFTPGASGITATNVNAAIIEAKNAMPAAGSTGNIQYRNAAGVLGGFGTYDPTGHQISSPNLIMKGAIGSCEGVGNWSGGVTIMDASIGTMFVATVTGAITSMSFGLTSAPGVVPDHTFKLLLKNPSGYAVAGGSGVKWLNGTAPNFAVAGNHLCTFSSTGSSGISGWIGQYNGTVA